MGRDIEREKKEIRSNRHLSLKPETPKEGRSPERCHGRRLGKGEGLTVSEKEDIRRKKN